MPIEPKDLEESLEKSKDTLLKHISDALAKGNMDQVELLELRLSDIERALENLRKKVEV